MGRDDIVEQAALRTGLSKERVRAVLNAILDVKRDALENGEPVVLEHFGTYRLRRNPPRLAQDFQNGERILLGESTTVRFKPARSFGDRINRRAATSSRRIA